MCVCVCVGDILRIDGRVDQWLLVLWRWNKDAGHLERDRERRGRERERPKQSCCSSDAHTFRGLVVAVSA